MERAEYKKLKALFGANFIGPFELSIISEKMGIIDPIQHSSLIPKLEISDEELLSKSTSHILLLFIPIFYDNSYLNICKLRNFHKIDPLINEPCFYNQDWYVNEKFANNVLEKSCWYLINKQVAHDSRGLIPSEIERTKLHPALVLIYAFFINYFHSNEILWENDFIWTSDVDANNDLVYVGRYIDPTGLAKNGFSIHRHLSITKQFGQLI